MQYSAFDESVSVPLPQSAYPMKIYLAPCGEALANHSHNDRFFNVSDVDIEKNHDDNSDINPQNTMVQLNTDRANEVLPKPVNDIKIMFWNIQGIGSKLELQSINNLFSEYELVFLFETMKLDTYSPTLPNFKFVHCQREYKHPRARRPSGGIGVLIRESISHSVKIEKINEHVIWLSIKQYQKHPLIIGGTYIPPAGSKIYLNYGISDIFQALQTDIAHFLSVSPYVALCGDFNSRTGGLSDIVAHVTGKDNEFMASLNDVISISHDDRTDWAVRDRSMKDNVNNAFGKELVQMCINSNMRIMNGFINANETDEFTCHAALGKSTVDYLLCTQNLSDSVTAFDIHSKLVESDHVPLSFSVSHGTLINTSKRLPSKNKLINNGKDNAKVKRFKYVFDKDKMPLYKEALKGEEAQDKLVHLTYKLNSAT